MESNTAIGDPGTSPWFSLKSIVTKVVDPEETVDTPLIAIDVLPKIAPFLTLIYEVYTLPAAINPFAL